MRRRDSLELKSLYAYSDSNQDEIIWINPFHLETVTSFYLSQALYSSRASGIDVLDEFVAYPTGINGKKVCLTHTLVHRSKIHPITGKLIHLYSIEGGQLGKGKYGSAYAVNAALEHKENGEFTYSEKPRAVKIQEESLWSENEAQNSVIFPHLHAKPPTIINAGSSSTKKIYILMKRFAGEDLDSILKRKKKGLKIPPEKLLRITINTLRALEEQIHFYGYVHRDIKPANIIVNLETCEVNIIDVGFSRKEEKEDNQKPGSPGFYAPEVITERFPYNRSSDIYALSLALRELWGAPPRTGDVASVYSALKAEKEPAVLDITNFKDSGLSTELNNRVLESFKEMAHLEQSHRSTSNAIAQFESIEIAHKLSKLSDISLDEKGKILAAHIAATGVRQKLRGYFTSGALFHNLRKQMYSDVLDPLNMLQNHPAIIEEYARLLGVTHLQKETCKFTLMAKVKEIFQEFDHNLQLVDQLNRFLQTLNAMIADPILGRHLQGIDRDDLIDLQTDVALLIYRHQNKIADLNAITQFNNRVKTKIFNLNNRFDDLCRKVFYGEARVVLRSYNSILNLRQRLRLVKNCDDELGILKNNIRSAMMLYISSTLTFENLKSNDRAGSSRRQIDIEEIINLVDSANSYQALLKALEIKISRLETGILGRSELRDQLNTAIKNATVVANKRLVRATVSALR